MADLRIEITPAEMRQAAEFLGDRKDEIVDLVNQISAKIKELEQTWKGAAQSTFMENYEGEMKKILEVDFPDIIVGLASQLTGAADAIEVADEEVANAYRG